MPAKPAARLGYVSKLKAGTWRPFSCSSSMPLLQPPTSKEVHVWCLFPNEIHQTSLLCSYENILPCEERSLLHAKDNKVQKDYLLTRILARTLLARYTEELDPSMLKFEKSMLGKPKIVWPLHNMLGQTCYPPEINFNISHTGSLIVCAIAGDSKVGIDVEEKGRETQTNLIRFARRKFSEEEASCLEQLDDLEACKRYFLWLWTLKESYGKAVGSGIAGTTLRDATFSVNDLSAMADFPGCLTGIQAHKQVFQIKSNKSNIWRFVLVQLCDTHYASVCVQRSGGLKRGIEDACPLRLQIRRTIPLVKDEPLLEAVVLGLSI